MSIERDISPLRYPGSKQKLIPYIEEILRYNSKSPDNIVEPFFGGGSITLSLLTRGLVERAIISDYDPLVSSFWSVLFYEPGVLIEFINKVRVNLKVFYSFKEISRSPGSHTKHELAKACLFLNRTSFSGIVASSSGPIGGAKQQSAYSIDCRFNKESIIKKIEYIAAFNKQVIVLSYDWKNAISYALKNLNRKELNKSIFYFDPPFFHKANNLYNTYFNNEQHVALSVFLHKFRYLWILSYDNTPEIHSLYLKHNGKTLNIEMPYSINSHAKRLASELMITPLNMPQHECL